MSARAAGGGGEATVVVQTTPGENTTLRFVLVVGNRTFPSARSAGGPGSGGGVRQGFVGYYARQSGWAQCWAEARRRWEGRWQSAFVPHNGHYSGYLPVGNTSGVPGFIHYWLILSERDPENDPLV